MSFNSSLKLDSPLWNRSSRQAAGGRGVVKTANQFKDSTARKMIESDPRGRIYQRRNRFDHRASARGQRPARDSGALADSGRVRRISQAAAEVTIGENLPYTEELAKTRQIVTDADRREAQELLIKNMQAEISALI